MHLVATWLIGIVGGVLTALTFGGFLGRFYWLFDVFTHFNLQYAVLLALCFGAALFVYPYPITAVWLLPALAANLVILAPYFWPASSSLSGEKPLRVLTLNVLDENDNVAAVSGCVLESGADIALLAEVEPDFLAKLQADLADSYPHLQDAAQPGYFGIVLFSKLPFLSAQTHHLGVRGHPSLKVVVTWQGQPVTVYGAHPYPPTGPRGTYRRDTELMAVGNLLSKVATPLVLMGDLNATPWSSVLRRLMDEADLRSAMLGHGVQPTWRLGSLAFGAPLDQVLVSPHWEVTRYRVGAGVGSDHYPVIADLCLQEGLEEASGSPRDSPAPVS